MRRSKEIIILVVLLLVMMGYVLWYVIDRRSRQSKPVAALAPPRPVPNH